MLPSTPRNACWPVLTQQRGNWTNGRGADCLHGDPPRRGTACSVTDGEWQMVIAPRAFRARSALVSRAPAGHIELSEPRDFEDASIVQIDNILNQALLKSSTTSRRSDIIIPAWCLGRYKSLWKCQDHVPCACTSVPSHPAAAEIAQDVRGHCASAREFQRRHVHSELYSFDSGAKAMAMSNCFGIPFLQQKLNFRPRSSKIMLRGALPRSSNELSMLVWEHQSKMIMMLKEIESWPPTHPDDMPWTSGPKSGFFCSGQRLKVIPQIQAEFGWRSESSCLFPSCSVLKAEGRIVRKGLL